MLKQHHLAVVRAALKYLDEEISPNGTEVLLHYLDEQNETSKVTADHIVEARDFFDSVELNYALVDSLGLYIESERLIPALSNQELSFQSDLSLLATVLVKVP